MNGRGDVYRFEPPRFLRGLLHLSQSARAIAGAHESPYLVGLRHPIQPLLPGDPTIAQEIYRGRLKVANRYLQTSPQLLPLQCKDQFSSEALLSLSWLPHLAAADLSLYRGFSRNLFNQCVEAHRPSGSILCRRLMILSSHAGFLLEDAPAEFTQEFFRKVSRDARKLQLTRMHSASDRLQQALTLLAVSIAFRGAEELRTNALNNAASIISDVIMADGGHVSRSPQALLRLLLDLIPVLEEVKVYRLPIPVALARAIQRGLSMLRMMCHGDGGLALFQGVDNGSAPAIAVILANDSSPEKSLRHATDSGYARLDGGKSTVILDVGRPGLCRSALAFEFSHGRNRIVTSCGTPEFASRAWREAAGSPAAHSGLQLTNIGRTEFPSFFRRNTTAINPVHAEVVESTDGVAVRAADKSYKTSTGIVHHREIFLTGSGCFLAGEDRFTLTSGASPSNGRIGFTLRFHLDPSLKVFSGRSGSAIMLLLPNRGVWQFSVTGAKAMVEESVLIAGSAGIRPSQQIVIRGASISHEPINWTFRKIEKPSRQFDSDENNPGLPF